MQNWFTHIQPASIDSNNYMVGYLIATGNSDTYKCAVVRNEVQNCFFIIHKKAFDGKDPDFSVTMTDDFIAIHPNEVMNGINLSVTISENMLKSDFFSDHADF